MVMWRAVGARVDRQGQVSQGRLARAGRVGWLGRAGYSCETSNFERS